eukprot:CAMPEP_0194712490 /NCGR_PEP_ID=MMETSP0296-20130528/4549_1 /TAXON_ID=39354 /ORGANISM="Heterosigma akashiwo, Strain CCMP2393" /LENGTH=305 /DNA_ID=CAMNT_0039610883 /DNA_START=169 /DNA_END=1086 /DNA_ORIENTATION=-
MSSNPDGGESQNQNEKEEERILQVANEMITKEIGGEKIPKPANNNNRLKGKEDLSPAEYFFGKDGEFMNDMIRNGVSPRRFFLSTAFAGTAAVGANLFGITSGLLSLSPSSAQSLKLDTVYPVSGFKRWVDKEGGYEFIYPQDWLEDQAVAYARQTRNVKSLQLPDIDAPRARPKTKPDIAFGPPGGDFKENVSVIKSPVAPGFVLKNLGGPNEAATKLISTSIAPEGSGKEWTFLGAFEEERNGKMCYQFEYLIKTSKFFVHNIGVITTNSVGDLYTLIVLAPEAKWDEKKNKLAKVAASFQLL